MRDQTLQDVDETLIEAGKFLKDITCDYKKLECLRKFTQCPEVVAWINEVTEG